MLRLTDEELSRVQDLCRVLPSWKRGEFLQELTRRLQGRELNHADLCREAATAMRAVLGRGHAWVPARRLYVKDAVGGTCSMMLRLRILGRNTTA